MEAKLIPIDGSRPVDITNDLTLVGRKYGLCDLIVDRASVSKLHCLIVKTDGLLFVRDLGSTNGTKVNGQRVTRGALLPGDELAFASVKYRVHLGPGQPAEEKSSPDQTEQLSRGAHDRGANDIGEFEFDGRDGDEEAFIESEEGEFVDDGRGWDLGPDDDIPDESRAAGEKGRDADGRNGDSLSDVRLLPDDNNE